MEKIWIKSMKTNKRYTKGNIKLSYKHCIHKCTNCWLRLRMKLVCIFIISSSDSKGEIYRSSQRFKVAYSILLKNLFKVVNLPKKKTSIGTISYYGHSQIIRNWGKINYWEAFFGECLMIYMWNLDSLSSNKLSL